MRDDICTIPVSEVFEENDGCPICRMRNTIEERIISYILGDAMMEPDVRIETNKVGFCEKHYDKMLNYRARLQLSLMLQTHIDEINKNIFSGGIFKSASKRGEKAAKILANRFKSIDNLINADIEELITIDEIGEITAKAIRDFFSKEQSKKVGYASKNDIQSNIEKMRSFYDK